MPVAAAVILAACTTISLSALWQRRSTWHFRWERPITAHLACMVATCILTSPAVAPHMVALHTVTGLWNLEDGIAHVIALAGLGAYTIVLLNRLELPPGFTQMRVGMPMTLAAPTLVALFLTNTPDAHAADLWGARVMPMTYWALFCGTSLWLLGHALWALLIIRGGRGTVVVNAHIVSTVACMLAGVAHLSGEVGRCPSWVMWLFGSLALGSAAVAGLAGMQSVRRSLAIWP